MAKVVCFTCKNKIDKKFAFAHKPEGAKKFTYYCNEEHFKKGFEEKENKDIVYKLISNIFGREIINSVMYKELGNIAKVYPYSRICGYLRDNEQYLTNVMQNKSFASEYAKIMYFIAIIKNHIGDYVEVKKKVIERECNMDVIVSKYKRKTKRKPLEDYELEVESDEL